MAIYERFWNGQTMRYTITEAYDFIEAHAPDSFNTEADMEDFQRKVNERFLSDDPLGLRDSR